MSNVFDRAKEGAKSFANKMRTGAERVRQDVKAGLPSSTGDYVQLIHQTRTVHLVILAVQVVALYLEADDIGIIFFVLPFLLIIGNAFIVGKRWHYRVDGRYDIQQLTSQQPPAAKAQYALGLLGGFVLALLTHFVSPYLEPCFTSFIYNLAKYLSVLVSGAAAGIEIYEGINARKIH